ncbi:MAG TPA: bifunctional salicylyl-CoA 5-hydroxylase/oxidoreductase [Acidobacteriota bacterium]|nr:bifunctional salicylyl-CoA 5-hydroxylase/oxidoreductase [Acidobacteriota bacterium]
MKIVIVGGGPAGLYFGLLQKKNHPDTDVTIIERSSAGTTWGWGVVFSDETLEHFQEADPLSYEAIAFTFARWTSIEVHFRGEKITSRGHVFCGIRRMRLLHILQERCKDLGVRLYFDREADPFAHFRDADLIVAADGINSKIRTAYGDFFRPDIQPGRNRYIWLATSKVFDSFKFFIRENEHGLFVVHAYPFDRDNSTFIVEADEESWKNAGMDRADEETSLRYCEDVFREELDGHSLYSNNSAWIQFRRIKNQTWHYKNMVLIGDAAHTAHFSIGSGTKLAMEDSIALVRALEHNQLNVEAALQAYERERWVDVAKLQRAAEVSQTFFEDLKRWKDFEPMQFAIKLLSRSKRITHGNLMMRDPEYIASVDKWFASRSGCSETHSAPPPMFTPFRLRDLVLSNRVVVSPMCQYSAEDGTPNEWHLVHLGSRAIGGAGLVFTEMTDVSRDGRISPGCAGMYKPEHVTAWKRIVDFVHSRSSARIGMQLAHAGRKGSTKRSWEGNDEPLDHDNWPLISASAIPWSPANQTPREMNRQDMDRVRDNFVRAAEMALEAGFDILEIHMAHGYLFSSFISPLCNLRTDEYGGSVENRMRFPLEVFDAVRQVWPVSMPISVRISATDWAPGGLEGPQSVAVARLLKEHGCDIIDVSTGSTSTLAEPVYGSMYQAPFSDRIRNEAKIPTITVGNIQNWDQVNTLIVSGQADLCALARPHLNDPYFTLHAAAEQEWEIPWPNQYLPAMPKRRKP